MDFAEPGQITASRAFFDAVASLDSAYAGLFRHVGAPDDKHGRAHELYAISPSATVLEKLKLDLGATTHESAEIAAKSSAKAKGSAIAVTTDSQTRSSSAVDAVRKWTLPIIAVIALGIASIFVGTRMTEPNAPKIPQATTEPVLAPTPSKRATAPPAAAESAPVDAQTSPAIPPKSEVAAPVGAARGVEVAPALAQPTAPAVAAAKTNANIKPRTSVTPAVPVPANAASERSSPRCSRIMEKATLGETLSTEEKRELANSCR
jgi:hypothetical protein